ncbi:MAG: hypothetical protein ACREO0_01820 [Pseudoxanthomonas sp.]
MSTTIKLGRNRQGANRPHRSVVIALIPAQAWFLEYSLPGRGLRVQYRPFQTAGRQDVFQVGPLLSPDGKRLLFAQADGERSGELFLVDLEPGADSAWPRACD